jgi:hypothetical protein
MGKVADGALHTELATLAARLYTGLYITTRYLQRLLDITLMSYVTPAGAILLWHFDLC